MLAIVLEGLVEESNEEKRFVGAPGSVLRELLQDKNVGLVGGAGGKLEELAQLVDEQKHTRIASMDRSRIDISKGANNGGAVEEGVSLGLSEQMANVFGGGLELTLRC
jgi:hypothetical protein